MTLDFWYDVMHVARRDFEKETEITEIEAARMYIRNFLANLDSSLSYSDITQLERETVEMAEIVEKSAENFLNQQVEMTALDVTEETFEQLVIDSLVVREVPNLDIKLEEEINK